MEYRRFGRTELQIPVISCGGMRFQQGYHPDEPITETSQRNVQACVRHALELGIDHIETARGYGSSELQLGKILPQASPRPDHRADQGRADRQASRRGEASRARRCRGGGVGKGAP